MIIWTTIFWINVMLVLYVYMGYPVVACMLGKVIKRRVNSADPSSYLPSVTVIIPAFNEASVIVETVTNKLQCQYPHEKINIIVVSDESEDGTDDLVRGIDDDRITLIRQIPRAGKTSALNLAMKQATGEIIVYSDANSLYAEDALQYLVAPFADPEVGYVTGRMVYKAPDGSLSGVGCSSYMSYENKLRSCETALGSIVGVDGGIDATRRSIYHPMQPDQLPDFVQPLQVRQQGLRVVYEERALLYEDALAEVEDEFRMRVRVSLRAFHAMKDKSELLDPFKYGIFAWQLLSHKLLRYLAPLFMILAFIANIVPALAGSVFWQGMFAAQIVFYTLAVVGHLTRHQSPPQIIGLIYYLCVLNLASGIAFVKFLMGRKQVIWKPRT